MYIIYISLYFLLKLYLIHNVFLKKSCGTDDAHNNPDLP